MDSLQIVYGIASLAILYKFYSVISTLEPFCFYLSNDLSDYYTLYKPENQQLLRMLWDVIPLNRKLNNM